MSATLGVHSRPTRMLQLTPEVQSCVCGQCASSLSHQKLWSELIRAQSQTLTSQTQRPDCTAKFAGRRTPLDSPRRRSAFTSRFGVHVSPARVGRLTGVTLSRLSGRRAIAETRIHDERHDLRDRGCAHARRGSNYRTFLGGGRERACMRLRWFVATGRAIRRRCHRCAHGCGAQRDCVLARARLVTIELGEGPVVCAEHRLHAREIMLRLHATEIMLKLFDPLLVVRLARGATRRVRPKGEGQGSTKTGPRKEKRGRREARGERREERVEVVRRGGTHRGQRSARW